MSVINRACIHTGTIKYGQIMNIESIPYPTINDDQILIKAVAYAANPADWKHIATSWGSKGDIAGSDVSGTVVEVGSKVKGYEIGDIVSSFMHGNFSKTRGAFSEYVIADTNTTIKYDKTRFNTQPLSQGDHASDYINTFEGAASVTLGLSTVGVSFHYHLGIKTDKQANSSKYILIWGGATATGILAVQVAKIVYNLKVITTASPKHHEYLKSLGADVVFDYRDSDVIEQIRKVGHGNIRYALDTVSESQTYQAVFDATADSKECNIDNLLFLQPNQVNVESSRKFTATSTLVYCVDGTNVNLNGLIIPADKKLVETYNDFWFNVLPQYISKIKHTNLKVLAPGLDSSNEALDLLRGNTTSGEKIVFRSST